VLLPQNTVGRIRRVEVYGQSSDTVMAGQCAAINVGHWDHHAIHRGDTLTLPGFFTPQSWFVCSLRLLQREKILIKSGAEVRFHTGTSDVAAMFYPAKGHRMESGDEGLIQIKTKMPVVAGPGDPFLLRTQSPVRTIGGGIIVEAIPERLKTRHARVYEDMQERAAAVGGERRFVEYCVRRADSLVASEADLVVRAKIPARRMQEILADFVKQQVIFALAGKLYTHRDTVAEVSQRILDCIVDFHRQSPESPGITWDQLRQTVAIDKTLFDEAMTRLKSDGRLVEKNQRLAMPDHRIAFQNEDAKLLDALESMYREKLFAPPGVEEATQRAGVPSAKTQKLLGILREHGQLVLVEGEMLFHRDAVERAREIAIAHFQKEERLESVQFKYLLDTTRKFALPLLDHLDRIGVTRRVGNTRYLKASQKKTTP
jgi:selenocysteine-specific elongation factor